VLGHTLRVSTKDSPVLLIYMILSFTEIKRYVSTCTLSVVLVGVDQDFFPEFTGIFFSSLRGGDRDPSDFRGDLTPSA